MKVFLTHNPEDLSAYYGRALPQMEAVATVITNPKNRDLSTPELLEAADGCDVIVAHRSTPGDAELFNHHETLLAFLRCAVDISTINVPAASTNGVLVARADKSFVPSTAELALGLLIDTARKISQSTADYHTGNQPPQRPGRQLRDQTAGIIGYGAIGSYLAGLLQALGMRVMIHDPNVSDVATGVTQVGFDELLAVADVIFPLAQATPETDKLIGVSQLAAMKPGATLINVSRGELVDEVAVAEALDSGQLGALGMDVGMATDQRPSPELARRSNVVATPHLGGLTPENADAQAASSVEQVVAMQAGELPPRAANPDDAVRLQHFWERNRQ